MIPEYNHNPSSLLLVLLMFRSRKNKRPVAKAVVTAEVLPDGLEVEANFPKILGGGHTCQLS